MRGPEGSWIMKNNKAFTLIEFVMTIVIVGIIAAPLGLLIGQQFESVFVSREYHEAMNLARFEMERVKKMSYANIITASFTNYQGHPYDIMRTVSFVQGNAGSTESLKQVTVDLRKTGSPAILFSLKTYIARNVLYGI